MAIEDIALTLRQSLRNLLGSRLSAHLEDELYRLRGDYESRLADKDRVIADLRERNTTLASKIELYEMVVIPLTSQREKLLSPRRPDTPKATPDASAPKTWQEEQLEWYKGQEAEAAAEKSVRGA